MFKIDSTHDMEEYLALLSTSQTIFMDDKRLTQAYKECCYECDDLKAITSLCLSIESAGLYSYLDKDYIIDYLRKIGVDMDKRFASRKTKSPSLDMKRVIEPLIDSGVAVELLSLYKEYKKCSSCANSLRKLTENKQFHDTTITGRNLIRFSTHVDERENLRVYYSDIAVVSVPKKYSNMITGPSDAYYIAWCDFPQADWRIAYNLFIRDEHNEKVMRECEDSYEGLARLVEGDKFDAINFKEHRKDYKVHCLKVFYNSRDSAPVPSAIRQFYLSCPKYRKILYDLGILYRFKLPIPVTSYFGFEQLVPEGEYPDKFISKALNTPIQTGTSHLVNETVLGILNTFWSLGYTKEDINIYYVRHDEFLFLFTKEVLKDAWVFKEFSEIHIPGFTPIHLDFHYGRYYQEEDKTITDEVNRNIANSGRTFSSFSAGEAKQYNPYPTVESVYATVKRECNDIVVHFHNYRDKSRNAFKVVSEDPREAIPEALNIGALDWLGNPKYLLITTVGIDQMDYAGENGDTLVKIVDGYDCNISF